MNPLDENVVIAELPDQAGVWKKLEAFAMN
jgi:hypothetical protein